MSFSSLSVSKFDDIDVKEPSNDESSEKASVMSGKHISSLVTPSFSIVKLGRLMVLCDS